MSQEKRWAYSYTLMAPPVSLPVGLNFQGFAYYLWVVVGVGVPILQVMAHNFFYGVLLRSLLFGWMKSSPPCQVTDNTRVEGWNVILESMKNWLRHYDILQVKGHMKLIGNKKFSNKFIFPRNYSRGIFFLQSPRRCRSQLGVHTSSSLFLNLGIKTCSGTSELKQKGSIEVVSY